MNRQLVPLIIVLFALNAMAMEMGLNDFAASFEARKVQIKAASKKIYLGEWDNQTNWNIVILSSPENVQRLAAELPAQNKSNIGVMISLERSTGNNYLKRFCIKDKNDIEVFGGLHIQLHFNTNNLSVKLLQDWHEPDNVNIELDKYCNHDIDGIFINGLLKESDLFLCKSRIFIEVQASEKTLKKLCIKAVAEHIKSGTLKFEQTKRLPIELREAVEQYANENQ